MDKSDYKSISNCRICGHNQLRSIFDFGKMHLLGSFFNSKDSRNKIKLPLNLVMCKNLECNLIQLKHNFAIINNSVEFKTVSENLDSITIKTLINEKLYDISTYLKLKEK